MRGGAGTALVGDPETVAARIQEYMALGIDTFILSGYPHLEEAYRFAELVFPLLPLAHVRVHGADAASTPARSARPSPTNIARAPAGRTVMSSGTIGRRPALEQPDAMGVAGSAILVVWQVAARLQAAFPARVLPAPTDVVAAGWKLLPARRAAPQHLGELLARHRRLR